MKKRFAVLVIGGLFTATAIGWGINASIVSAAESPQTTPPAMHEMMSGNKDSKATCGAMNSPEMQNRCIEAMKSPEMQKTMQNMMGNSETQKNMSQLMPQMGPGAHGEASNDHNAHHS